MSATAGDRVWVVRQSGDITHIHATREGARAAVEARVAAVGVYPKGVVWKERVGPDGGPMDYWRTIKIHAQEIEP